MMGSAPADRIHAARLPLAPASALAGGLLVAVVFTLAAALAFRLINAATDPSMQMTQLYAIASDGSGLSRLITDDRYRFWGAAWSPDGRRLAYTLIEPNAPGQLFVADADGSNQRQITRDERGGYLAAWSPDGKRIAFLGQPGTDATAARLYLIDADGTHGARVTTDNAWEYGASWSPDGTRIVFGTQRDGTWTLYTVKADGSGPTPLIGAGDGNAPSWSPDGRQIAFKSGRSGHDSIYVINADGSNLRRLVGDDGHDANNPVWSPDGTRIAFSWDRDGKNDLFVMDADGSHPTNLTYLLPLAIGVPTWSADGKRIGFHARDAGPVATWTPRVLRALVVCLNAAMLLGVILILVHRWRLPLGAVTVFALIGGIILGVLLDQPFLALTTLVGGVLSDVVLATLRPSVTRPGASWLAAILIPFALSGPPMLYLAVTQPDDFPVVLALATVAGTGLAGLGMQYILGGVLRARIGRRRRESW